MPTIKDLDAALDAREARQRSAEFQTLGLLADNWLSEERVPSVSQTGLEAQSRNYQGFWDELGRVSTGNAIGVSSGMLGTLARDIKQIKFTGSMLDGMGLPGNVADQIKQITPAEKPIEVRVKELSDRLYAKSQEEQFQPTKDGGF